MQSKSRYFLWLAIICSTLWRFISLNLYPLMDTFEARYGEMARLMIETGNWHMLQVAPRVPFFGEPLSILASALGISAWGVNEFAVRMPHYLSGLCTIIITSYIARKVGFHAVVAATVLVTCTIFILTIGVVIPDIILTLAITIAILGFYNCWLNVNSKIGLAWGYIAFIGLAGGLLTKGLVAFVIVTLALFPWLVIQHGFIGAFKTLWQRFPLVTGMLLMLAIIMPWYILVSNDVHKALDFFIISEHFKSFVANEWQGNLYGYLYNMPRGMIWFFWLLAALPWSIILPILVYHRRQHIKDLNYEQKQFGLLMFCWLIAPMILFSLAKNILPTYLLSGMPALALLVSMASKPVDFKWMAWIVLIISLLSALVVVFINLSAVERYSDRKFFEKIDLSKPVFYVDNDTFSGKFYSNGQAQQLTDEVQFGFFANYYLIGSAEKIETMVQKNNLNCRHIIKSISKKSLYECITIAN